MVLDTWNQKLDAHAHVHALVPGGGPSLTGDRRWIKSRRPNVVFRSIFAAHSLTDPWLSCRQRRTTGATVLTDMIAPSKIQVTISPPVDKLPSAAERPQ